MGHKMPIDLNSGGARPGRNMDNRSTPVPGSALYVGHASADCEADCDGACDFGDEATAPSRRPLLRRNQDRRDPLAPTGIFPCSSLQVPSACSAFFGCRSTLTKTGRVLYCCGWPLP